MKPDITNWICPTVIVLIAGGLGVLVVDERIETWRATRRAKEEVTRELDLREAERLADVEHRRQLEESQLAQAAKERRRAALEDREREQAKERSAQEERLVQQKIDAERARTDAEQNRLAALRQEREEKRREAEALRDEAKGRAEYARQQHEEERQRVTAALKLRYPRMRVVEVHEPVNATKDQQRGKLYWVQGSLRVVLVGNPRPEKFLLHYHAFVQGDKVVSVQRAAGGYDTAAALGYHVGGVGE